MQLLFIARNLNEHGNIADNLHSIHSVYKYRLYIHKHVCNTFIHHSLCAGFHISKSIQCKGIAILKIYAFADRNFVKTLKCLLFLHIGITKMCTTYFGLSKGMYSLAYLSRNIIMYIPCIVKSHLTTMPLMNLLLLNAMQHQFICCFSKYINYIHCLNAPNVQSNSVQFNTT